MRDSKTAIVLTIGDELLNGRRLDGNLNWISGELHKLGIHVKKAISICDNVSQIKSELLKLKKIDYVFITGGLGGTSDDVTIEAIQDFLNSGTYFDEKYYAKLKAMFIENASIVTPLLKKQAIKLNAVKYFDEAIGTAQGFKFDNKGVSYFVFPGVPRELKYIFLNRVKPFLIKNNKREISSHTIDLFGLTEGYIFEKVRKIVDENKDIKFSFLPSFKKVSIILSSLDAIKLQKIKNNMVNLLDPYVYSDKGETLETKIKNILIDKKMTLSTCESCTAGKLSEIITRAPGSSLYYKGGVTAYSNEIKNKVVNIDKKSIDKYGAVSKEIAIEMANKVSELMESDISISITGLSGPESDSFEEPVGTVFIAIKILNKNFVNKYTINYDREKHREISSQIALNNLRLILLNKWSDNIYKFK